MQSRRAHITAAVPLAEKLAFLGMSDVFDGVLEVIETHMSWVFLTERHALKLKKPIRLPYVDYRTIERRRRSCENELRLGRRLAANVYETVLPLVATRHGLALGGDGDPIDWIVVMRRLPRERMLPEMLERAAATRSHADELASLLAAFYGSAPRATWSGTEYRRRQRAIARDVGAELVALGAAAGTVDPIVRAQLEAIDRLALALDARIAEGRVVDAHGDLRPEHVCLESPHVVIDPLEFHADLRMLDALSELAFFALECERLDAAWFGERVLVRYAEVSGDPAPAALRSLYRSEHALTRALLAVRRVAGADAGQQQHWRAKTDDYLARAAIS